MLEKRWLLAEGPNGFDFTRIHLPLSVALIEEASKLLIC
jgi:hypothetical protein